MSKIAIIDLDSVIYSAGHPNKVLDKDGQPKKEDGKFVYIEKNAEELVDSARSLITNILVKSKATHYIAFVKGRNTIKSRLAINPEYKQNRKGVAPVWFNFLKEYYITQWKAVAVDNIEVDDAINITYLEGNPSDNYFRCCIDKDLLNLYGENYNWRTDEWFKITSDEENNYFWKSMIIGDTIDNIKGIEGKGKVFAEKLLSDSKCPPARVIKAYIEKYGEIDGITKYYQNYSCLKILEKSNGFVTPSPVEFKLDVIKETDNKGEVWE